MIEQEIPGNKDYLCREDIDIHCYDVLTSLTHELHAAVGAMVCHRPVLFSFAKYLRLLADRALLAEARHDRTNEVAKSEAAFLCEYRFFQVAHCGSC